MATYFKYSRGSVNSAKYKEPTQLISKKGRVQEKDACDYNMCMLAATF